MTPAWVLAAVVLGTALPAFAQTAAGFVYVAPGGEFSRSSGHNSGDAFLHFGGGGEFILKNGIGFEADAGAITEIFGGTRGAFSVDGAYHFRRQRRVDPFVNAGYSLFFSQTSNFFTQVVLPHFSLVNFGGGTNLWFSHHLGARIQIRDHLHVDSGATVQFVEVMLGLGFR